jgi:methylenetetrahydrofolate reductase (NADPH)
MIASPNATNFSEIIRTAKRLRHEGMEPVPHIVARSIPNLQSLESFLDQLQLEADVNHVLLIAGDLPSPVGPFSSSMDILDVGIFEKKNIKKIGVSGHPEGSPTINENELWEAIRFKNKYALDTESEVYICTQFVFESAPVIAWEQKYQERGYKLPIKVGIPGIASAKILLRMAAESGIGKSMRFLTHQAPHIEQLLTHHTPDKLVKDLAIHCAQHSSSMIESIHFYPFGGMLKTSEWAAMQLESIHAH